MTARILLSGQNYKQLIPVVLGSFFGMLMLLLSVQLYFSLNSLLTERSDLLSAQFLVINKPVSLMNTLSGSKNTFSEEEINQLQSLDAVSKIGRFVSNSFKARAGFEFGGNQMLTDIFFESVPDSFLDISVDEWKWKEGDPIPIILPSDYINLYNFGFAPVQGLPQISRATAKMAGLKIIIGGRDAETELSGRIAGFTDRINSVLVPMQFLEHANKKYGFTEVNGPSRLVLQCDDVADSKLSEHLLNRGYESNSELLKSGKLNTLLKMILSIVLLIGMVIVMMALLGFVQYAQLMVSHSSYEIKTLMEIGYHPLQLLRIYMLFYSSVMFLTAVLSLISLYFLNSFLCEFASEKGFQLTGNIHFPVYMTALVLSATFILLNSFNTAYILRRKFKSS